MGISPRRSGRSAASSGPYHTVPPPSPRKRRNSHNNHSPSPALVGQPQPPHQQQGQGETPPAPDDEDQPMLDDDSEDDEDDGSAEITRCVCGQLEYPFPDADIEDTGFMICCERCNVWQHGPCIGVMSENEAPDVYFCEECRPDLHELGNRSQGIKQSRWIGGPNPLQSTSGRRKKSTAMGPTTLAPPPTKHEDPISSPDPSETPSKERKPSPKKRSTMNSRDAAYDYSSLFPVVSSVDDDGKLDPEGSPPPSNGRHPGGRSRRGKRLVEDDDDPDVGGGRKRRRGSNETSDPNESSSKPPRRGGKRGGMTSTNDSDNGKPGDESSSEQPSGGPGTITPLLDAPPPPARGNGGKRGGHGGKRRGPGNALSVKMDGGEPEEPPMTPTTLRRWGEEIMKPARARIPQARSGLNEMRKRVGAILEFVGRLQAEANGSSTPNNNGGSPVPDDFVEGGYDKPDLEVAPSVIIMQYLTKRCLEFEFKFGKYPGRYP